MNYNYTSMISCVAVGSIIGIQFDAFFNVKPLCLIIGFALGIIAGITNAIRGL